ncbi:MAG: nitrilase-related carbon-nitrogen hydrolase [Desulfuromonadales bacterium]
MLLREMGMIRVAAVSPALRVADVTFNRDAIEEATLQAADQGVQLLVFPELALTGYTCGDLFYQQSLLEEVRHSLTSLTSLSEQTGMILIVGAPVRQSGRLFNAAVVMSHGRICGVVPKTYLPNTQEFYEERWFSSAADVVDDQLAWLDEAPPFGTDLLFDVDGLPDCLFGIEICEDGWVANPPSGAMAAAGATLLINLSASPEILGKCSYRRALVEAQSARCLGAFPDC